MSRKQKSKKYLFTLSNINTEETDRKYGITLVSNISQFEENLPDNTTKISELNTEHSTPEVISFLDESKKQHQCNVSMIDFSTKTEVSLLRYYCFWCRHPFNTKSIGCPINYISNQAIKNYYSEITRDTYTIKENITSSRKENVEDDKISVSEKNYYKTDGVFCSFNCCKAYIRDNKHNKLYSKSEFLLSKMYNDMMGTKMIIIDPAPHWRLLREYGGFMSIQEFRSSFNKAEYECHGMVEDFPVFKPSGMIFEEKIKF